MHSVLQSLTQTVKEEHEEHVVLSHSLHKPPSKNLPVLQESQVASTKQVLQLELHGKIQVVSNV